MVSYEKGDIVAVIDSIPDPKAKPGDSWRCLPRTFYGKVTGTKQSAYSKEVQFKIHSSESTEMFDYNNKFEVRGISEDSDRIRKANFLEKLLYKFISKKSWPKEIGYNDYNISLLLELATEKV